MRIERTGKFKRDYKREAKGRYATSLATLLNTVLTQLMTHQILDIKYQDHALTGQWSGYRDCHLKPDLILIYRKLNKEVLQIVGIGSHSELGL